MFLEENQLAIAMVVRKITKISVKLWLITKHAQNNVPFTVQLAMKNTNINNLCQMYHFYSNYVASTYSYTHVYT